MSEDYATDWRDDTITAFPAIRDEDPEKPADPVSPCWCEWCTGTRQPGTEALLSCAPGVTSRMWRTRMANGQWDDIQALADHAHARIHLPALDEQRRIRTKISAARHDIAALFTRNPGLHPDPRLAEELDGLEERLAGRLEVMRQDAAEREKFLGRQEDHRAEALAGGTPS
jgi:hypothetical protein